MQTRDEKYMKLALWLAQHAANLGEVPVGAVIVCGDEIVSTAYNRRELDRDALSHAELLAIESACKRLHRWRLSDCELFVTLEPCPMCCGAIINARIGRVIYGTSDPKAGCCGSVTNLFEMPFNHQPQVTSGILQAECGAILSRFFEGLRDRNRQRKAARSQGLIPSNFQK